MNAMLALLLASMVEPPPKPAERRAAPPPEPPKPPRALPPVEERSRSCREECYLFGPTDGPQWCGGGCRMRQKEQEQAQRTMEQAGAFATAGIDWGNGDDRAEVTILEVVEHDAGEPEVRIVDDARVAEVLGRRDELISVEVGCDLAAYRAALSTLPSQASSSTLKAARRLVEDLGVAKMQQDEVKAPPPLAFDEPAVSRRELQRYAPRRHRAQADEVPAKTARRRAKKAAQAREGRQ